MQAEKPWKLVKSTNEQEKARAYSVVSLCANISCLLALLVEPFMPHLAGVMLEQLNAKLEDVNVLGQTKEEDRLFRYFCFVFESDSFCHQLCQNTMSDKLGSVAGPVMQALSLLTVSN